MNLCAHFVVPLNESMSRKGGHTNPELFLRFPDLFYFILLIVLSEYLFCFSLQEFLYSELNTYLSFNWPKCLIIEFTSFWPHFLIPHYAYMYVNLKPVMYLKTLTGAPMLIFLTECPSSCTPKYLLVLVGVYIRLLNNLLLVVFILIIKLYLFVGFSMLLTCKVLFLLLLIRKFSLQLFIFSFY